MDGNPERKTYTGLQGDAEPSAPLELPCGREVDMSGKEKEIETLH